MTRETILKFGIGLFLVFIVCCGLLVNLPRTTPAIPHTNTAVNTATNTPQPTNTNVPMTTNTPHPTLTPTIIEITGIPTTIVVIIPPTIKPVATPIIVPTKRPVPVNTVVRIGALCKDGTRSDSIDKGTCSRHKGVLKWLYK